MFGACVRPVATFDGGPAGPPPAERTLPQRAAEGDFQALATLSEQVELSALPFLLGVKSATTAMRAESLELGVEPRGETGVLFPGSKRPHFAVFAASPKGDRKLVHLELGGPAQEIPTPKNLALYDLRAHDLGDELELLACARDLKRDAKPALLRFSRVKDKWSGPAVVAKDSCDYDTILLRERLLIAHQAVDRTTISMLEKRRFVSTQTILTTELEHPRFVATSKGVDVFYVRRTAGALGTYRARGHERGFDAPSPWAGVRIERLVDTTFSELPPELPRGAPLARTLVPLTSEAYLPRGSITLPPQLDRSPRRRAAWIVDDRGQVRAVIAYDGALLTVGLDGASILYIGTEVIENVAALMEGSEVRVVFAELGTRRLWKTLRAPIGPRASIEATLAELARRAGAIRRDTLDRLVVARIASAVSRISRGDFDKAGRDALFALQWANTTIELQRARALVERLVVLSPGPTLAAINEALVGPRTTGLTQLVAELDIPADAKLIAPAASFEDEARFLAFERIVDPDTKARGLEVPATECLVVERGEPSLALRTRLGTHLAFLKFPPDCPRDSPKTELVLMYASSPDEITVYARSASGASRKHHAIHLLRRSGALELMGAKERPFAPESFSHGAK